MLDVDVDVSDAMVDGWLMCDVWLTSNGEMAGER